MEKADKDAVSKQRELEAFLKTVEEKKKKFDVFMSTRGQIALDAIRREKELNAEYEEEIKQIEKKKQTRVNQTNLERTIAQQYREKAKEATTFFQPDFFEKAVGPFHNHGTKIDYSTTRYHNVQVMKHVPEEVVNAEEKAEETRKRTAQMLKEKEVLINEFNKTTAQNAYEEAKRQRCAANLKLLEEKLKQLNREKRTKKQIAPKTTVDQEKVVDRRAQEMLETLLKQKKEINTRFKQFEEEPVIPNESQISSFYRDEVEDEPENEEETVVICDRKFEEPVTREFGLEETFNRLAVIDMESYSHYNRQINKEHEICEEKLQHVPREKVNFDEPIETLKPIEKIEIQNKLSNLFEKLKFNSSSVGNTIKNPAETSSNPFLELCGTMKESEIVEQKTKPKYDKNELLERRKKKFI